MIAVSTMSDAEVSLPPSVGSNLSEPGGSDGEVSLPPSVNGSDHPGPPSRAKGSSCCRNVCLETWREKADELQLKLQNHSFRERRALIFEEVKRVVKENSSRLSDAAAPASGTGRLKWSMFGASVCRIFCERHCFQCNPKSRDKMIKHARSGLVEIPERGRYRAHGDFFYQT